MNRKFFMLALFFVSISLSFGKNIKTLKVNSQDLSTDVKGVYGNIQAFFNSIFNNAVNLEIVDSSMKTISGRITHQGSQIISPGLVVYVSINDVSIADARSHKLAESIYTNKNKFPIDFSVQIDSKLIKSYGSYSLSVRIEKDGELRYYSDTYTSVTDESNNLLSYPILVNVIKIPVALPPKNLQTIKGELFSSVSDCSSPTKDQIIKISISDVSLMDAPSVELTSKEYKIGKNCRLPFKYEFEFDSGEVTKNPWKRFSVSAKIVEAGSEKLNFISDFDNPLVDFQTNEINKTINIHLVKIAW